MNGWWSIGRVRGVPVRVHWSALAGAVWVSGFRFAPGAWLGFVLLILAHELGHALLIRAAGQHVLGIDVHAIGGECRWTGRATPLQRAWIAWGGVIAQVVLFALALPLGWLLGGALGAFGRDLVYALTWTSLWIAAVNLIPIAPLDGAQAWRLPPLLASWWRSRQLHHHPR